MILIVPFSFFFLSLFLANCYYRLVETRKRRQDAVTNFPLPSPTDIFNSSPVYLHLNSTNHLSSYFEAQLKNHCISSLNISVCSKVYFKFNSEQWFNSSNKRIFEKIPSFTKEISPFFFSKECPAVFKRMSPLKLLLLLLITIINLIFLGRGVPEKDFPT